LGQTGSGRYHRLSIAQALLTELEVAMSAEKWPLVADFVAEVGFEIALTDAAAF
jgi:hypothetical protein